MTASTEPISADDAIIVGARSDANVAAVELAAETGQRVRVFEWVHRGSVGPVTGGAANKSAAAEG